MIPAAAIVMTKNEERNIGKCLRSLSGFAEIFVVDSNSTDATPELAAASGATVVTFTWNKQYPKKKQWCLDNLSFGYDWVLFLDADEELTPAGAAEIRGLLHGDPQHAGYYAWLDYAFAGRVLRHGHRMLKLVLLDRRHASFPEVDDLGVENFWEVEGHYQPHVDGTTGKLHEAIVHDDHANLFEYFERHNRYSDWEAALDGRRAIAAIGAQPRARRLLKRLSLVVPFKGSAAFFYSYFLRLGLLDGRAGFQFAVSRAFYYWQIELKRRELQRQSHEYPSSGQRGGRMQQRSAARICRPPSKAPDS